uniref:Uncharacterized protein n=1 Tax=Triticum urartu TaxID=4572 RepID=A0A8R7V065_TRIUA
MLPTATGAARRMPVCVASAQSTVTNSPPSGSTLACPMTCSSPPDGATYTMSCTHRSASTFHIPSTPAAHLASFSSARSRMAPLCSADISAISSAWARFGLSSRRMICSYPEPSSGATAAGRW